jgi:arginase
MAEAASLELPYPEAAVVSEDSLGEQTLVLASELPERPLVLGGCCCCHVGAVEGLSARHGRVAVVWIDAHGDLNTPETSPSGNQWGMPLRMLVDSAAVDARDVALVGVRDLDPPERDFIRASGINTGKHSIERALSGAEGVYVAIDADGLDKAEVASFTPVAGGVPLVQAEQLLREVVREKAVVGAGLSGLLPAPSNVEPMTRLCAALGL